MDRQPLSVGIVGAGHVTSFHHLPILSTMDAADISYIADIDVENARRLSKSYGAEAVQITDDGRNLPGCDAALLATPVGVRTEYVREFGRRGTPILTEKPFAPDVETHRLFLDLAETIACNYQRKNYSSTRRAREAVASGPFGRLDRLAVTRGMVGPTGMSRDDHRLDTGRGGGILMDIGCHMLSQIVTTLGGYSLSVERSDIAWNDDLDVAVSADIVARGERSIPVEFALSTTEPLDTEIRLEFEQTTVSFDQSAPESQLSVRTEDDDPIFGIAHDEHWATSEKQAIYLTWERFFRDITEGSESETERRTEMKVTQLIEDIYEGAR